MGTVFNREPRVFITAPHSYCNRSNNIRHCDTVAELAADTMILTAKSRNINYIEHVNRTDLRSDGDYNRDVTYYSDWRIALRDKIKTHGPNVIIETHSFIGEYRGYQTPLYKYINHDLVMFKTAGNASYINEWVDLVISEWPDIKIAIDVATHPVSISDEFAHTYLHSLCEFNENADPERIKRAAKALFNASLILPNKYTSIICKRIAYVITFSIILLCFILIFALNIDKNNIIAYNCISLYNIMI